MARAFAALLSLLFAGVLARAAESAPSSDGQIAKVLVNINEGEIEAADIAKKKASSEEVKNFADTMRSQHRENKAETTQLSQTNHWPLDSSPLSRSVEKEADGVKKSLNKSEGKTFDKQYIRSQVAMHEKALSILDKELIPNAKSSDLKNHLEKTRTAVDQHLQHARSLETKGGYQ
jgi:putative membrane protein